MADDTVEVEHREKMNGKEVWRRIRNYKNWNGKKCIKRRAKKGKVAG
jgi:hypothetical protein